MTPIFTKKPIIYKKSQFYKLSALTITVIISLFAIIQATRHLNASIGQLCHIPLINTAQAKIEPIPEIKEPTMKEWVMNEFEKAGIDKYSVYCLIEKESKWNPYAIGTNKDGYFDIGLFQISEKWHKDISRADKFDYKKSTMWAINKIKHDGNLSAWHAYTNFCK